MRKSLVDQKEIESEATEVEGDQQEEVSDENVVYQINTFGADYTVDGLVKRFEKGTIYRPKFQRNFVWTHPQASKFIESILLGLPIPSVFLYKDEATQKQLIVDGLQRLTTLHAFQKGVFQHNDKAFRLKDVKSRFEGKKLEELSPEDQLRFEDAVIHVMVIQQAVPDDDNSSVFHIFDRLNSNGTPLQPQEIRAAVYNGSFQDLLLQLNDYSGWRKLFGAPHKRAKDQELILRFLALHTTETEYTKPMKGYLNEFMRKNRNPSSEKQQEYKDVFESTIDRVIDSLGTRAFRPQRALNVAVFDSFMVAVASHPRVPSETLKKAYDTLMKNEDYLRFCSEATSNEASVTGRVKAAKDAIVASE